MKVQRISTALSLALLTALAVAPIAQAVGDPNIDSGVGSAASRGPYGFNHTGNIPVYDTPPNDYGVWRDAYGGLRDTGMQPDNLTTRVPEPTWEDTHPMGPPVPSGSPGGLASAAGGGIGIGLAGLGASIGFPLGGGLGSLGSFTGTSPISAAAAASLTNTLPIGNGTGLGPYSFPRSTFGFAGTGGAYLSAAPFTGQRYNGQGSGYLVTPSVTTSNLTANGTSTNTTTWNTTYGPAQFIQATSGPATNETVVTTFAINGNRYSSTSTGVQASTPAASVVDPNIANLLTMFGLNIPVNMPAANSSITTRLTTGNATSNPYLPGGYNFDPNAFVHNGSPGTIGSGWATPATEGGQDGYFWTNSPGSGFLGASFSTQATSGSPSSVFFGGNFSSNTIGGGYPTNATAGGYRSSYYPNVDIGNTGGIGGGNLASVGYGLPGYGVPNVGVGFPGYSTGNGGSTAAIGPGISGGAAFGAIGPGFAGGGNYPSNGSLTATAAAPSTNVFTTTQAGNGSTQAATTTTGTVLPAGGGGSGSFTQNVVTAPVNGIMSSTTETNPGGTSTTNTYSATFPPPVTGGYVAPATGAYVGQGPAPVAGPVGPLSSRLPASTTAGAYLDNGDGAYGFFGGTPAVVSAVVSGSEYGMPFIGNQVPTGAYAASSFLRNRRETESRGAAGYGPIGNITTDLEPKLAALHLTACQAIGHVIGSMRFANGDILTYGTNGTLRLAADNSGSITLNDGEILTFKLATPEVREVALRSTLLF